MHPKCPMPNIAVQERRSEPGERLHTYLSGIEPFTVALPHCAMDSTSQGESRDAALETGTAGRQLRNVDITFEPAARTPRPPDYAAEDRAYATPASEMVQHPRMMLRPSPDWFASCVKPSVRCRHRPQRHSADAAVASHVPSRQSVTLADCRCSLSAESASRFK
jgi:hypothetical protein